MARELANPRIMIGGSESGPSECRMDFHVAKGDLSEPSKSHIGQEAPNFNQSTNALGQSVAKAAKKSEGIS